jgi:hypothetical protein
MPCAALSVGRSAATAGPSGGERFFLRASSGAAEDLGCPATSSSAPSKSAGRVTCDHRASSWALSRAALRHSAFSLDAAQMVQLGSGKPANRTNS